MAKLGSSFSAHMTWLRRSGMSEKIQREKGRNQRG